MSRTLRKTQVAQAIGNSSWVESTDGFLVLPQSLEATVATHDDFIKSIGEFALNSGLSLEDLSTLAFRPPEVIIQLVEAEAKNPKAPSLGSDTVALGVVAGGLARTKLGDGGPTAQPQKPTRRGLLARGVVAVAGAIVGFGVLSRSAGAQPTAPCGPCGPYYCEQASHLLMRGYWRPYEWGGCLGYYCYLVVVGTCG